MGSKNGGRKKSDISECFPTVTKMITPFIQDIKLFSSVDMITFSILSLVTVQSLAVIESSFKIETRDLKKDKATLITETDFSYFTNKHILHSRIL